MEQKNTIIEYEEIPKGIQVSNLIDSFANRIKNIPRERIEYLKSYYASDNRSYNEIEQEITKVAQRVIMAEQLVNKEINPNILANSIILIGPMGSGKSTVANILREKYNMPHVSLDNKHQLSMLYEQRDNFSFKEFEFFLTSTVLTNLQEPTIIDFGAGHSIYEDEVMFLEMQSLISKFSNVILLMPSENKEESIEILNQRKGIEPGSQQDNDNRHFVNIHCNYDLASMIEYTKNKNPEQIAEEIIEQVRQKQVQQIDNGSIKK